MSAEVVTDVEAYALERIAATETNPVMLRAIVDALYRALEIERSDHGMVASMYERCLARYGKCDRCDHGTYLTEHSGCVCPWCEGTGLAGGAS